MLCLAFSDTKETTNLTGNLQRRKSTVYLFNNISFNPTIPGSQLDRYTFFLLTVIVLAHVTSSIYIRGSYLKLQMTNVFKLAVYTDRKSLNR